MLPKGEIKHWSLLGVKGLKLLPWEIIKWLQQGFVGLWDCMGRQRKVRNIVYYFGVLEATNFVRVIPASINFSNGLLLAFATVFPNNQHRISHSRPSLHSFWCKVMQAECPASLPFTVSHRVLLSVWLGMRFLTNTCFENLSRVHDEKFYFIYHQDESVKYTNC